MCFLRLLLFFFSFFRLPHTHSRCFCLGPPYKTGPRLYSSFTFVKVSPSAFTHKLTMLSELECGICYRLFDAGRRCPRQLRCKHSFCESCLLTLAACRSETFQPGSGIICAFCRHTTPLNKEKLKDNLPVDEDIFSRLETDGVLEERASDGEDDDEEPKTETSSQSKEDDLPTTQRGRVWRSIKRLYKKLKAPHQRGCITDAEMRDLALMACYMM